MKDRWMLTKDRHLLRFSFVDMTFASGVCGENLIDTLNTPSMALVLPLRHAVKNNSMFLFSHGEAAPTIYHPRLNLKPLRPCTIKVKYGALPLYEGCLRRKVLLPKRDYHSLLQPVLNTPQAEHSTLISSVPIVPLFLASVAWVRSWLNKTSS